MADEECAPKPKAAGHYGPVQQPIADIRKTATGRSTRRPALELLLALHWPRLEPIKHRLRTVTDDLAAVPHAPSDERARWLLFTAEATLDASLVALGLATLPKLRLHPECIRNGLADAFCDTVRDLRNAVEALDRAVGDCARDLC